MGGEQSLKRKLIFLHSALAVSFAIHFILTFPFSLPIIRPIAR